MIGPGIESLQLREWIYGYLGQGVIGASEFDLAEVGRVIYYKGNPSQQVKPNPERGGGWELSSRLPRESSTDFRGFPGSRSEIVV